MALANNIQFGSNASLVAYRGAYNTKMYYGAFPVFGGAKISWDADALEFITSGSITNPNEMVAINNLVTSLKSNSNPWANISHIYPFISGNSGASNKNLKDYNSGALTFGSGITTGSLGITGDGTSNSYADTGIQTNLRTLSYGLFVVDDVAENSRDFGAENDAVTPAHEIYLQTRTTGNNAATNIGQGDSPIASAVTSSRGFTTVTATIGDLRLYKEGNLLVSGSQTGSRFVSFNGATYAIGAYATSNTTWTDNSTKTYGFAFATSQTLTSTQVSELNSAVQDYITLLGR